MRRIEAVIFSTTGVTRRRLHGPRVRGREQVLQLGFRLVTRFRQGRGVDDVQALAAVDDNAADLGSPDLADLVIRGQQKTIAHEWVLNPTAIEIVNVHSDP